MDTPSVYKKDLKILAEHVTMTQKLRPSVLLRFLQEASIAHTEALGAGRAKTLDRGFLWVILNQHIEIRRMPIYDDHITVESWPGPTQHVLFPRHYRILSSATGEAMVSGAANWIIIDAKNRKMIFPDANGITVPGIHRDGELEIPPHISFPELDNVSEQKVTFSRTDINGHLNNTSYLDLAEDLMPVEFPRDHSLKTIDIAYKEEIRSEEKFTIHYGQDGNAWYFQGEPKKFTLRMEY